MPILLVLVLILPAFAVILFAFVVILLVLLPILVKFAAILFKFVVILPELAFIAVTLLAIFVMLVPIRTSGVAAHAPETKTYTLLLSFVSIGAD